MLPLAYAPVPLNSMCIKLVRLQVLPVGSVAVVVATLAPSTNRPNAVPLRLNATECQAPSNAIPPEKATCHSGAIASGLSGKAAVVADSPMCALLLVVDGIGYSLGVP